jgi:putative SOS response-associated peptidase YedK
MCGRYVTRIDDALEREWSLIRHTPDLGYESYNVAPTQEVPVIRGPGDGNGGNQLSLMRWGLIPFWAQGVAPKYSTINATIEKLKDAPTWRGPWRRNQRCAQIATGFYEWQVQADGSKVPYYIHLNDQEQFGFAAIWDASTNAEGVTLESCAHVTLPANALLAEIHNSKRRMPAILAKEDRELWLNGSPDEAFAALKPYPDTHMVAWPVSTRVNKPSQNDARLINALSPAAGAT